MHYQRHTRESTKKSQNNKASYMKDILIALLLGLSFCLAFWQDGKATKTESVYAGCTTDYDCEQMKLIEQQRETYYGRENTY